MNTETQTQLGTATYSPEDNKIRFYPDQRLSKEDYDRARAAGFKWAPKQELFLAPMWTPDREDLMLEWCGEIGDEDKSLMERQEERADRFRDYSANRAEDATQARAAVSAIADRIPLGQPILVGHHSEKRARRDAEKIENGMRKAVKMWDQSQYWKQRAAAAIGHARYKERPDVRARRIKTLEAELRKFQRGKKEAETSLKLWLRPMTQAEAYEFAGNSSQGHLYCTPNDHGSHWSAYDVLEPDPERRYKSCPSWTVQQVQEVAKTVYPKIMARCDRWINHYTNRLEYERAMLAQDGGTPADKTGPEVGGACRCWCNPEWSKIIKVNKVSVTVLDNWGNGGADFTRTVPFTDLKGVMSKTQVDQARAEGRLFGETTRNFMVSGENPTRIQTTRSDPPPEAKQFEALRATVAAGVQVVAADQLFPTPAALACRLVECAELSAGETVLEPSAGTGALCLAAIEHGIFKSDITAVEINANLIPTLERYASKVYNRDFLDLAPSLGTFDKIIMNPPFKNGIGLKHVLAAFKLLNPGGILVGILPNLTSNAEALEGDLSEWTELPEDTFKPQGTSVRTALFILSKSC